MAALHDTVIGRKRQPTLEAGVTLGLVLVELLAHEADVGDLEVIDRELAFVLQKHIPIGHGRPVGRKDSFSLVFYPLPYPDGPPPDRIF